MQEHEKYEEEEEDSKGEQKGGPNRMGKKKPVSANSSGDKQTRQANQEMRWKDIYLFHAITATTLTLRTATTVLVLPLLLMDVCQLAIH